MFDCFGVRFVPNLKKSQVFKMAKNPRKIGQTPCHYLLSDVGHFSGSDNDTED